jgi:excinuclease UvrABC ATPase subunit
MPASSWARWTSPTSTSSRAVAGHLDRPEDRLPQPPLHGGTVTEIWDYLRLLFARIGIPHCPNHGLEVRRQTPQQIVDQILELPEGTRFQVLAPVVRGRKGEYEGLLKDLAADGFARARIDGEVRDLTEDIKLDRYFQHSIEVVVDRLVRKEGMPSASPSRWRRPSP